MPTTTLDLLIGDYELKLDLFWLRDHCRCGLCYDFVNSNRKINILNISDDISTKSFHLENKKLLVDWDDDHKSEYELDFLIKHQPGKQTPPPKTKLALWNQDTFSRLHEADCRFTLGSFKGTPEVKKRILECLHVHGVVFIDGVDATQDATETVVSNLFAIQKTFFGEMWTFSEAQKDLNISAYTSDYLGPHNDNVYFRDAAGLQVLHCVHHSGAGGENFLIDGFQVADKIKKELLEVFNRLTRTIVGVEYKEAGHHFKYSAPIINLDAVSGEVVQVRYNMDDRVPFDTVAADEIRNFYKDFKILAREFQDEGNQGRFKLNPGTVMIWDNWRLLHGRYAYTGSRTMTGCYVSRDEYQSALRVNGFIE